jgi:hypothetical protein
MENDFNMGSVDLYSERVNWMTDYVACRSEVLEAVKMSFLVSGL